MKEFKDLKPEDISKLVGTVTISFRVKPETKLKLQLAAKKYNISFAKFCENLMENQLKETKGEKKTEKNESKPPEKHFFKTKQELVEFMKKEGINNIANNVYTLRKPQEQIGKRGTYIIEKLNHNNYMLKIKE